MPIDLANESPLTLAQAARLVPPSRGDRPTQTCTLSRWITVGSGGVKLEAARLGGRWLTSASALQRFSDAQTAAAERRAEESRERIEGIIERAAAKPVKPAKQTESARRASAMLDAMGW